ncbi:hypothetical protein HK100_000963 [Physocladia obscura]|uniref:Uncharacterized protein n=1 Tax=Physocladia obscura TaxID=109957 RepID=A0AAD5XEV0_9FUNG|nr:hypothetical protein HK100_000963 [Physocladia obscura]
MAVFGRFGFEVYPFPDPNAEFESALSLLRNNNGRTKDYNQPNQPAQTRIACDRFGGAFRTTNTTSNTNIATTAAIAKTSATNNQHHHLWLDFNNVNALSHIPSSSVARIIVDWSTWRYMFPASQSVRAHWLRILEPAGDLLFEATVSSIAYSCRPANDSSVAESILSWDFDNPSHVTVSASLPTSFHELPTIPTAPFHQTGASSSLLLATTAVHQLQPHRKEQQQQLQLHHRLQKEKRRILSAPQSRHAFETLVAADKDWELCQRLYPALDAIWVDLFMRGRSETDGNSEESSSGEDRWGSFELHEDFGPDGTDGSGASDGVVRGLQYPISTKGWVQRWFRVIKQTK